MGPEELVVALRRLVTSHRDGHAYGERIHERFAAVESSLDELEQRLFDLQEFVVLTDTTLDGLDMGPARAVWNDLPAETDVRDLRGLIAASPTLTAMHRAGIDFRSVWRYQQDRLDVAADIGRHLAQTPQYVRLLPPPTGGKAPVEYFSVGRSTVDDVDAALRALTGRRVLSGFRLQGRVGPPEKRYWRDRDKLGSRTASDWRVVRGTVPDTWRPFLAGHWLTAYAYGIALDQFTRAGAPFEIYSNLSYTLPGEMGGGSSDLDVVIRTADQVVLIECKSGRLLGPRQDEVLGKVARNATQFDRVLTEMNVPLNRTYLLVHSVDESEAELAAGLARHGGGHIEIVMPARLRPTVVRLATGRQAQTTQGRHRA